MIKKLVEAPCSTRMEIGMMVCGIYYTHIFQGSMINPMVKEESFMRMGMFMKACGLWGTGAVMVF